MGEESIDDLIEPGSLDDLERRHYVKQSQVGDVMFPPGLLESLGLELISGDEVERRLRETGYPVSRSQSCSWCHHLNESTVEYCSNCGHYAQIPRMQCYCPSCNPKPLSYNCTSCGVRVQTNTGSFNAVERMCVECAAKKIWAPYAFPVADEKE
jgi:hypothetical protein